MQPTIKSNSTKDFCKTCTSWASPVPCHWTAWHRGLGVWFPWDGIRALGFRMCREGPRRRQCWWLRKPKEHCSCALQGAWRSPRIEAESTLQQDFSTTRYQTKEEDEDAVLYPQLLSVTGRQTCPQGHSCRASCSHPLPQKMLVWGFRHFQGLWKPPLGCAPILSKQFKDTNEVPCLSGSMSQSDKNWNKTPQTKAEERGRKRYEALRSWGCGYCWA